MKEIIHLINESLELKELEYKPTDQLLICPTWDSLGLLAIIANFKEKFNIQLSGLELNKLVTFKDLYNYISSKR